MSAMQAPYGLSQDSVIASMYIFFENNKSLNDAVLPRADRTFVVANLMLRLMADPRLILTPPARRSTLANLNVGLEQGIGSNLRLKQRLRHDKSCKKESE